MTDAHPPGGDIDGGGGDQPRGPAPGKRRHEAVVRGFVSSFGLLAVWGVMIGYFAAMEPDTFLTFGTFRTIMTSQQPLVFLALALVIAFTVGEFDISVSATLGLSATITAVLNVNHEVDIRIAVVVALLAAILVGCINGTLIVVLGVNPIVTTLGMSTLLVGIGMWMTNVRAVAGVDRSIAKFANTDLFDLPLTFWYGIVLAIFIAYVLWATPLGRHMAFVGENREVARLAGIRVQRIRFGAYVSGAFISGVGGVLVVASVGGFDPQSSTQYLLPSFAAAFLGTTVIVPGRFNPIGSLIAIYFLVTGIVGLQYLGFTGWVSQVFFGGALIVAVTLARLVGRDTNVLKAPGA